MRLITAAVVGFALVLGLLGVFTFDPSLASRNEQGVGMSRSYGDSSRPLLDSGSH